MFFCQCLQSCLPSFLLRQKPLEAKLFIRQSRSYKCRNKGCRPRQALYFDGSHPQAAGHRACGSAGYGCAQLHRKDHAGHGYGRVRQDQTCRGGTPAEETRLPHHLLFGQRRREPPGSLQPHGRLRGRLEQVRRRARRVGVE